MTHELMNIVENHVISPEKAENIIVEDEMRVYKGMNEVFEHTRKVIDVMQTGEKLTVKDLVDRVHAQVMDMSIGNVTNLVQIFVKNSKDVTVEIGRGGGVFKGGKPKRVDNRPRCPTCHQVVRPDAHKQTASNNAEETLQEKN